MIFELALRWREEEASFWLTRFCIITIITKTALQIVHSHLFRLHCIDFSSWQSTELCPDDKIYQHCACVSMSDGFPAVSVICKHFIHGRQEDAHEFVRHLLDSMQRCHLAALRAIKLDNLSKETTPLNHLFGGYLKTQGACCGAEVYLFLKVANGQPLERQKLWRSANTQGLATVELWLFSDRIDFVGLKRFCF